MDMQPNLIDHKSLGFEVNALCPIGATGFKLILNRDFPIGIDA